jgi:hypothetical protein
MIKPTVGRVVWVRRAGAIDQRQPEVALIVYVHSDRLINVAGYNANGEPFRLTSLPLKQGEPALDDWIPDGANFAEWMPYQVGQAARTRELEERTTAGTREL